MLDMMVFVSGDRARYTGMAECRGGACIVDGDYVNVIRGNLDEDDPVLVDAQGVAFEVSAEHLVWVGGRA